jgi:hypothetical protein
MLGFNKQIKKTKGFPSFRQIQDLLRHHSLNTKQKYFGFKTLPNDHGFLVDALIGN